MVSHPRLHITVRHNQHLTCLEAQGPTLVATFRCNCIRVCHAFSVKIHVYSTLSVHSVFLHPCCSPHGPKCFFSYFMSPFLLIKWFQQKQKFPPPSTLTPSPIIQVQQSRLSQAAGDRGIAEGSWYLLRVRGFMVLDCFVWHVCEFSDVVFFHDFLDNFCTIICLMDLEGPLITFVQDDARL